MEKLQRGGPPNRQVVEDGEGNDGAINPLGEADAQCLSYHISMYAIADKYDVKGLKTLAQAKFESPPPISEDHKSLFHV